MIECILMLTGGLIIGTFIIALISYIRWRNGKTIINALKPLFDIKHQDLRNFRIIYLSKEYLVHISLYDTLTGIKMVLTIDDILILSIHKDVEDQYDLYLCNNFDFDNDFRIFFSYLKKRIKEDINSKSKLIKTNVEKRYNIREMGDHLWH